MRWLIRVLSSPRTAVRKARGHLEYRREVLEWFDLIEATPLPLALTEKGVRS